MAEVFIGSLTLVPYDFAPRGFEFCQGQLLSISENTALFSLLGTTYGGDGTSTFALPDLRGRVPVSFGQGKGLTERSIGESGGTASVTLSHGESAPHQHSLMAAGAVADSTNPGGGSLGEAPIYNGEAPIVQMNELAVQPAGGSMPHNNMMPYQALNWIIALDGIFPSRG
jgi:microcystin-dependent protein